MRRSCPTSKDIAAAMIILKVRRSQNNKDIDFICELLNALNAQKISISVKSIERKLYPKFNLKECLQCYDICSICGLSSIKHLKKCQTCDATTLMEFYLYPLKQQLQQLLLVEGFYKKLKHGKENNTHLFFNTEYGQMLREISEDSFTMVINCDRVCTPKQKHITVALLYLC